MTISRRLSAMLALMVVLSLVLSACGTQQSGDSSATGDGDASGTTTGEAAPSGEGITLEFPSFQVDEPSTAAWWNQIIDEFEQNHPGVTVQFSNSPGGEHTNLLATRFASGTPPEIVHMISRDFVGFAAQGWFDEIDSCFTDDTLSEFGGLQSFMEWNGETQGLLLNSYAYHLYYNQDILDEAGVDVPTTIDEFVSAVETINENTDYEGFAGITTNTADAYVEASMFVVGEGLEWATDAGYNLTDPALLEVIEKYRAILSEAPQGLAEQERNELFFTGNAAMMLDGNYFWKQIQDEASPEVVEAAGIAAAPFQNQPGAVSNSLHIPEGLDPEVRDLVCEFIGLAARLDYQQAYGEAITVPPPRDGAVTDELLAEYPEIELMVETKAEAQSVLPDVQVALENYGIFSSLIGEALAEMMASDAPTDQIMADLESTLSREIPIGG